MAELRSFVYIDRLQPQLAALLGAVSQGYLPCAGMAAAFLEVVPGIIISQALDAALKSTAVKPGTMLLDRHYGLMEFHSSAQAEVKHACGVVLATMGYRVEDRCRPEILSSEIVRKVDPHHAQLINVNRGGSLLLAGSDIYIMECRPAAYIALAANEAEKSAQVVLVDCNETGAVGRLTLGGRSSDIARAAQAARAALENVSGRQMEPWRD